MAKKNISLLLVSIIFLAVIAERCQSQEPLRTWCLVNRLATDRDLLKFMNFACSSVVNCDPIKPGGKCFAPDKLRYHASFVLNSYYRVTGDCWKGLGVTDWSLDPSYGDCHYE